MPSWSGYFREAEGDPHAEETMKHETVAALLEGYLSGSTDPKITLPELLARARATVR